MTPLIILIVSFGILFFVNKFVLRGKFSVSNIGRISLALMMLATGIAHFTSTEAMVQMMPDVVPAKREMVFFTGVCELLAVPGLIWNRTARLTSIMLIVFFVAILPANIAGSLKQVNFGGMESGAIYLVFRIPLQVFFISWAYTFGIFLRESEG